MVDALTEMLAARAAAPREMGATPLFFRTADPAQRDALAALLADDPAVTVLDRLREQLEELLRTRSPAQRLAGDDLDEAVQQHLDGRDLRDYGVWVYYPWSRRLVHLLDREEFIEARTSRNRNKITAEEQATLAGKRCGVIGLSVGQSVALTLALERTCGELRLADFDALELTNMNRIRAGLQDLGLPKVVIAAREIAEIDPFLTVRCFEEGITPGNLDAFLLEGGPLDLLIEECDGLEIKFLARARARELQLPVVMETSDRGMLDIERFDLEPERPLFHGLVGDLDPAGLAAVSNAEKLPLVMRIIGEDTMSARMKASMLSVGRTLPTWPQLGSAVVLGGATVTDIARRILLDQLRVSGRFFVDLEQIVGDTAVAEAEQAAL